jgi:epoxyqueuosine reductase
MEPVELAVTIKQTAIECGYVRCGITSVEPFSGFSEGIDKRMDHFPEAAHLYEEMKRRIDPHEVEPWAKAIVVGVRYYGKYENVAGLDGKVGKYYQFDRRYQECPDYQITIKFEEAMKKIGVRAEKSDAPDRWAGVRSGAVRFGRNNFVFTDDHGSWINVDSWFVDVALPPDAPSREIICPPDCEECIKACPTRALDGPFSMRMDRCIAYLTYRGSAPTDNETKKKMGEWIYGCDVCQDVCPRNKGKWKSTEKASWLDGFLHDLTPAALAEMDLKTYREKVHPLFWYIDDTKEGLDRWRANAKRSLDNA